MQALFNSQPTSVALYYPASTFAYRSAAYGQWQESRGFGIGHKNGPCGQLPPESAQS